MLAHLQVKGFHGKSASGLSQESYNVDTFVMPRFVEVSAPLEDQIKVGILSRARSLLRVALRIHDHADSVVKNEALQIRIVHAAVDTLSDPVFIAVVVCMLASWSAHWMFVQREARRILNRHGSVDESCHVAE